MNWLHRLFGLDVENTEPPPHPDDVVQVAMLPLWQTPMIIAALEDQQITANFVELATFPRARGGLRNAVVFVKQRDRSRAAAIIRLAGT